jgi:hypothetical protein
MRKLSLTVTGLFLLQSLCFVWAGWAAFSLFRLAGASWAQAFYVVKGEGEEALFFAALAILFYLAPRLRILIAAIGVLAGIYGAFWLSRSGQLFMGSLNPLHNNIIALSGWSEIIMVVLGAACALELVFLLRPRRTAGF